MRARRILLPLCAVLLAMACALAVLPARWLMAWMPGGLPLSVVDASGSIWNGRALVALGPPGMQRTLPDAVQWQWQWRGLTPAMRLSHPWLAGPLWLQIGPGTVSVSAQSLRLPASTLTIVGAPLNTLEPSGQLSAAWPALTLGGKQAAGPLLTVQWTDAASSRVRVQPLGSYRAQLTGQGDGTIALTIDSPKGPLLVEAQGTLTQSRLRGFSGTARPAPTADPETREALLPLLSLLGPSKNDITTLRLP